MTATIAEMVAPLVTALMNDSDSVPIRFWDGSSLGPAGESAVVVKSREALRRLLWAPGELGLGRAYVAGEIDLEGDIIEIISVAQNMTADFSDVIRQQLRIRDWPMLIRIAARLGVLGLPLTPPPEEVRVHGRFHSRERDAMVVAHHYDVGNEFYRLFLGQTMTYSCGYFESDDASLDDAQTAKYELICRKLGLEPGMRLLDIGCGWGGMTIHAAARYGVDAVGVTLSEEQAEMARRRVSEAGLTDRVEIRYQDYRDVDDGPYEAVSSIGMFEHVGLVRLVEYFQKVHDLLTPGGRFLNHAISRPNGSGAFPKRSFVARYVFPDGEVHEVGRVVSVMQDLGLEVRDVESLREHYAKTLRHWVTNLEGSWEKAVTLAGVGRTRIWRLYMVASALNFEAGRNSVHQVLAVNAEPGGSSGMPATRRGLLDDETGPPTKWPVVTST